MSRLLKCICELASLDEKVRTRNSRPMALIPCQVSCTRQRNQKSELWKGLGYVFQQRLSGWQTYCSNINEGTHRPIVTPIHEFQNLSGSSKLKWNTSKSTLPHGALNTDLIWSQQSHAVSTKTGSEQGVGYVVLNVSTLTRFPSSAKVRDKSLTSSMRVPIRYTSWR